MRPTTSTGVDGRPRGLGKGLTAVSALVLVTAAAGTGYLHGKSSNDRHAGAIPVASIDRLPSFSPEDWATFADYYVVVTITGEKDQRAEPDEGDPSTGTIGRDLTVRVDRVLWQRPSTTRPVLPQTLTWPDYGWSYDGDRRTPMVAPGTLRQMTGHSYALPVLRFPEGWAPLTNKTVAEYRNGRIYGPAGAADSKGKDPFTWSNPGPKGKPVSWMVARLRSAHAWKVCKPHHDSASIVGVMHRSDAVEQYREHRCRKV